MMEVNRSNFFIRRNKLPEAGNNPDRWLHCVYVGTREKQWPRAWVDKWAVRRNGSKRMLAVSSSIDIISLFAQWFANKHELKLFFHDREGTVTSIKHYDVEGFLMRPSQEFKTFYNNQMADKIKAEFPKLSQSKNIKDIRVRSRFIKKEDPVFIVVWVHLHNDQKVRIKTGTKNFPNPELIAKISLLQ